MAQTVLPFEFDTSIERKWDEPPFSQLPPALREACDQSMFLTQYVRQIPMEQIGIPAYFPKLSRATKLPEVHNLIYPTKEGLYVHIYPDFTGMRDNYISIEPATVVNIDHLMPEIDERLVVWAEDIGRIEDKDEKKALLFRLIDNICTTVRYSPNGKTRPLKIVVTPQEYEAIRYRVPRESAP